MFKLKKLKQMSLLTCGLCFFPDQQSVQDAANDVADIASFHR